MIGESDYHGSIPPEWMGQHLAVDTELFPPKELRLSELESRIREENSGITFREPISIRQLNNGALIMFDDPERTDRYIERARLLAAGCQPAQVEQVNFAAQSAIGSIDGHLVIAKRHPYTPTHAILVPEPVIRGDLRWSVPHEVSSLTLNNLSLMGRLAQDGWVSWLNTAFPTQNALHFHLMREHVGDADPMLLPLTEASLEGKYEQTAMYVVKDGEQYVPSPCVTTDNAEEALVQITRFTKHGHPPDMCVVRGSHNPLFVLYPTKDVSSQRGFVVDLFPGSLNAQWKDVNWQWLPSAENLGFILRPSILSIQPDQRTVTLTDMYGATLPFDMDWFICHMRKRFDQLHLSQQEIRSILSS